MKQRKKGKRRKDPIIALAQIKYFDISKSNNLEKIKKYIKLAKKKNADIVCFPESCIHQRKTLYLGHKFIKEISEECKKSSIWCIITDDIEIKNKPYNTAILINRKGEISGRYKKIHLFGDKVVAGDHYKVFKTDFAKIGIAICWDLAFPKMFKEMKNAGAEIVFCPAQWWYDSAAHEEKHQKREKEILESLVKARAYENLLFVALCNPVMKTKYQIPYSVIASPVKILSEITGKEGLITAKIKLSQIKKLHKLYR